MTDWGGGGGGIHDLGNYCANPENSNCLVSLGIMLKKTVSCPVVTSDITGQVKLIFCFISPMNITGAQNKDIK